MEIERVLAICSLIKMAKRLYLMRWLASNKLSKALNLVQVRVVDHSMVLVIAVFILQMLALISRYQSISGQNLLLVALKHILGTNVLFATESSQLKCLHPDAI